ncbi:MAG: hypothetical protein Q9211_004017 [Gyalolechia sp. 1 TL-2023]
MPTRPPDYPPDLEKRLNNDPAVCGWVEGSGRFESVAGGIGYGCGNVLEYDKSVLTSTTPGVVPFGQDSSTSLSSGSSETKALVQTTIIAAPSPSTESTDTTLISGGAIGGTVAASILVITALVGIVFFFWRRHRIKKEQERQAASMTSRRTQSYVYAQYAKLDGSTMSPPTHSRQASDQGYGFASSPPLSDNDRPWSPESVNSNSQKGPAELAAGHDNRSSRKY